MGSKRLISNASLPLSSTTTSRKDKKPMGSTSASPLSECGAIEENDVKREFVDILSIRDDPEKVETMTVQELRTILRSVGEPAKGRKADLVSALKCFLDNKMAGNSSHAVKDKVFSETKPTFTKNISSKRKVKKSFGRDHVNNIDTDIEESRHKRTKRRVKEIPSHNRIEVNTKVVRKIDESSTKIDEVSGKMQSRVKREIFSEAQNEDVGTTNSFDAIYQSEPWAVLAHKKPQKWWIPYNPRIMRPPPLTSDTKFMKVISWNVNGLRALLKLEGFSSLQLAQRENFDILCLQETKLQEKDVLAIKKSLIDGYDNSFWTCSASKLGYSGTAIISRIKPLSVRYGLGIADHDSEGRLVTAEFDTFYLISGYIPNSGEGLKRLSYRVSQWDLSLSNYLKELEKLKPVILTGDLNCAYQEIDIYNPAGNRRSAGFTDEERESFGKNFLSRGFVDTFRRQHPDVVGYTYWGYRHGARKTNKGWRLDYFLVSESIADKVHDSYILPDITGSDHCPIGLIMKL